MIESFRDHLSGAAITHYADTMPEIRFSVRNVPFLRGRSPSQRQSEAKCDHTRAGCLSEAPNQLWAR